MAPAFSAFNGRRFIAVALVAANLGGFASPALAAPAWLRDALGAEHEEGAAVAPPVARYRIDEGGMFTLDRSTREPLLKFEDSPEVWALSPVRGPRGDIIYRNDLGQPVLRATKLGGMTVFTSRRPAGSAASLAGPTSPLRLTPLGPVALYQRLFQASVRSSRIAQHLIGFDAPDASPSSDALIADAAVIVVSALSNLSSRAGGKARLARIGKIAFLEGGKPSINLRGEIVTITVAPSYGVAGRPSSGRILQALGDR
ncbi:MAG: DUF4908 domain-containing protein [Caulobacteraceae bacterium]